MKVLIISAFPPDPAPEANHALHVSEHLARSGVDVHVLCKKGSISDLQSIAVHPVMDDWSWSDLPRLAKCMKSCKPDVILLLYLGWIYNFYSMITFLPTICKSVLPGVPCVTQFENIDSGVPRRFLLRRVLHKAMALWPGRKKMHSFFGTLLHNSARIIVLSSPHKARLAKHCPEVEEKSVVLPPPPLIRFCPDPPAAARQQARDAIGAADSDFVLIYWGYIYPGKGVETLLQAFRIACRQNTNMRLVLVGGSLEFPTGPISCSDYFQMVQQLPEKLGIADRVYWTGHFDWDSDAGSRYLHAGDACVLPFDYGVTLNNSSLAAASTHGLPVISTELPVGRDEALEHGRNIYLCRPRDPEMLAEAIQLIIDNADLHERLRKGVLALARDWHHWDAMTTRLVGILESAVSSGKVSARDQSKSCAAASGAESGKHGKSLDMRPCDHRGGLPEVHRDNQYPSSWVWSGENIPDDISTPLVSVIVAVHNVGGYLSQCLDSLVNQTLKSVEIIVVNDASTDNSPEVINNYKSRYPNIRVFNCESNKGLATVRNIGMAAATGQYIAFTDGDDWVDIRMCEVMYRRASEDKSDVLIADATVFYENTKTFGQFFDQHIRKRLDPQLKTMPFDLADDPHVLLLEPVAWTKLYKRSFLQRHALQFEDGMNSYEDICFHFSVLLKATRLSLIDDALSFYRQNRPGQISGRKNRKIFEVFDVFRKIRENLTAWNASADIWSLLVKVQLRQFDWLLRDRVQADHKREFMASVARQFQMVPKCGFRNFARLANPDELPKLFCMRRNWLHAYEKIAKRRWPLFPLWYVMLRYRRGDLKRDFRRGLGMLRRRITSLRRSVVSKSRKLAGFEKKLRPVNDSLNQVTGIEEFTRQSAEPLVEVCRINDQVLFLANPSYTSGLSEAVRRMGNDYYLLQTAVFREGDTVVDIGAHVGAVSIYLARKFPFIKIYALEPDPLNYACLKRNIELNGVTNVTAINKAVSGDGQKRTLYIDAWECSWATIDSRIASSGHVLRTARVETTTLEQLFQEYGIWHCRLMKITALGAVRESLIGFTRRNCVDFLCGEADLEDCSKAQLEMASWRIARHHFWRIIARQATGAVCSWIQQLPDGCDPAVCSNLSYGSRGGQQHVR